MVLSCSSTLCNRGAWPDRSFMVPKGDLQLNSPHSHIANIQVMRTNEMITPGMLFHCSVYAGTLRSKNKVLLGLFLRLIFLFLSFFIYLGRGASSARRAHCVPTAGGQGSTREAGRHIDERS